MRMSHSPDTHRFLSSFAPGSPEHKEGMELVQREVVERDTLGPLLAQAGLTTED